MGPARFFRLHQDGRMSRFHWGLSVLLLYHLATVGLVALPSIDQSPAIAIRRPHDDVIASPLTPVLDSLASAAARIETQLLAVLEPVGRLTYWYQEAGIRQKWNMFASPKTDEEYLRIDYVTTGSGRNQSIVRELIL